MTTGGRGGGGVAGSTFGRGSEAGSGNEAHRAPGESGEAEGQSRGDRAFRDAQADPSHPRSRSQEPGTRGGVGQGQGASMPGSPKQQEEALKDDEG
jgi:hypothetical protein